MSEQENLALIRRGWALINEGDWEECDRLGLMQQIGAIPAPA